MTDIYYSQFGEDKIMSNFFDNEYKGICVEVGADNGISLSNTYFFEKKGWNCLCIEPIPKSFEVCSKNRKYCLNYCVSDNDNDNVDFSVVIQQNGNTSGISSLEIDERLLENHKNIIKSVDKISVNVRKLDTIFSEINFPKDIDFISIDTENTELSVLKGIDFDKFNIKFLIIENNFNESIIEEYLLTKNFKKLYRNVVNDFYFNLNYANKKIFGRFEIEHANFYLFESKKHGIVTDILKLLIQRFEFSGRNDLIVCNSLFFHDYIFENPKKLYITIKDTKTNEYIKHSFIENESLDFGLIYNLKVKLESEKNILTDSIINFGEFVDKYCILELKNKYSKDESCLLEIQKEIEKNDKLMFNVKKTEFYKQLFYINEKIFIDKEQNKNKNNANLNKLIYENELRRDRLKNYFNNSTNSNNYEFKTNADNSCFIFIQNEEELYLKIPEINYLCISYDLIYFDKFYEEIINKIFKNPNIKYIDKHEHNNIYMNKCILSQYQLEENIQNIFEFNTIKYTSGGKFGDFLNQLSVICENFYETGKKGELFIYEYWSYSAKFTFGKIQAFNDTYNIIKSQIYIKDYKIYTNQLSSDYIDLSSWRNLNGLYEISRNWLDIYKSVYKVNWGKHKWLNSQICDKWNNKIIINTTPYRDISSKAIEKLLNLIKNDLENCIFISNEKEHYDDFVKKTSIHIEYYKPFDFEETIIIINSCKYGIFGFTSTGAIANSLHKNHYIIGINNIDFDFNDLRNNFTHMIDAFV